MEGVGPQRRVGPYARGAGEARRDDREPVATGSREGPPEKSHLAGFDMRVVLRCDHFDPGPVDILLENVVAARKQRQQKQKRAGRPEQVGGARSTDRDRPGRRTGFGLARIGPACRKACGEPFCPDRRFSVGSTGVGPKRPEGTVCRIGFHITRVYGLSVNC